MRGFSVLKHRIKLLPESLMTVFKHNQTKRNFDVSIENLLEIIFIKQYLPILNSI